jgi:hypothetical protein
MRLVTVAEDLGSILRYLRDHSKSVLILLALRPSIDFLSPNDLVLPCFR